jgi:eukaryotic-like serine/threonine-protein kinase
MSDISTDDNVLGDLPNELQEHVRTEISAFKVERVANKGANGYLVFGKNNISGKEVAVKYYYWMGDDDYHAEPRKLASLEHPNIVKLDHAGYVNGEWAFFIMPQLRSGDLDDYISQGKIDLKKSIKLVFDIASALSELHSKGILHCDLKPENILLSDEGNVVIADFGSVKQLPEGADGVPGSGHSIAYRPPESFDGLYTKSGDVYQCGIVL